MEKNYISPNARQIPFESELAFLIASGTIPGAEWDDDEPGGGL
jgi:hypothetical protein